MNCEQTCRCWKCGLPVKTDDDNAAVVGRRVVQNGHPIMVSPFNRHLNPVSDERGAMVCEGTPSLVHQLAKLGR